jgi:pimeloyl-ACP methyl ester carboxylesterase
MQYPHSSTSFYQAADHIQQCITNAKLTPPILVAHSASTYPAQKFLESYAVRGLVLVNPVPPRSAREVLPKLHNKWVGTQRQADQLRRYVGVDSLDQSSSQGTAEILNSDADRTGQPFLSTETALDEFLTRPNNPDSLVNLERGMLVTLVRGTV